MEHEEAQELLELAAVEPDGFSRLAAGDTTDSAALAGHLAGCPGCAAEFERLGQLSSTLRESVRALPPDDLRERTLALVATAGRDRTQGRAADVPIAGPPPAAVGPAAAPSVTSIGSRIARMSRSWTLASAAAVVIAVVGVAGWWSTRSDLEAGQVAMGNLAEVTEAAVRVGAQPDATTVTLAAAPTGADAAKGAIVLSPASHEVVVVAEGLPQPEAGKEYRCWIEVDGVHEEIGKMYLYAGLATWAGWSAALESIAPGTRFGVSLVDVSDGGEGEPQLSGQL